MHLDGPILPFATGDHAALPTRSVRPAICEDVTWMLPMWAAMMQEHAAQEAVFALADNAEQAWQQGIWELMARHDAFVFVVAQVGFCCGWIAQHPPIYARRRVGLLSEICVAVSHRRHGVGQALWEGARRWFACRDVQEFQLATAHHNGCAQKFFARMGGRPILMRYHFDVGCDDS